MRQGSWWSDEPERDMSDAPLRDKSDAPLRVAVVGVGHLGKHHVRLMAQMDGAALVAAVDTQPERARAAAEGTSARVLTDYREILGEVDAVTIAVPTEAHRDVALAFL